MKKIAPLLISLLAIICCVFSGCSSQKASRLQDYRQAVTQLDLLQSRYAPVTDPQLTGYIRYLTERLSARPSAGNYRVALLSTPERFAYHLGSGVIVLSTGIAARLHSEAELAFLLAHEMAHRELEHTPADTGEPALHYHRSSTGTGADQETSADTHALGIMAMAGYDPRASVHALHNAYLGIDPLQGSPVHRSDYPSFEQRMANIARAIRASGWRPPGVVQKREFVRFRRGLLG